MKNLEVRKYYERLKNVHTLLTHSVHMYDASFPLEIPETRFSTRSMSCFHDAMMLMGINKISTAEQARRCLTATWSLLLILQNNAQRFGWSRWNLCSAHLSPASVISLFWSPSASLCHGITSLALEWVLNLVSAILCITNAPETGTHLSKIRTSIM